MHVFTLPRLVFPLAVLLPCLALAGGVAMPGALSLLSYGLFAATLMALPALALLWWKNTQPTMTVARTRRAGGLGSIATEPVRGPLPRPWA